MNDVSAPETKQPAGTPVQSPTETYLALAILVFILVAAAIVFLLVPPSVFGAKVEVIIHQ